MVGELLCTYRNPGELVTTVRYLSFLGCKLRDVCLDFVDGWFCFFLKKEYLCL